MRTERNLPQTRLKSYDGTSAFRIYCVGRLFRVPRVEFCMGLSAMQPYLHQTLQDSKSNAIHLRQLKANQTCRAAPVFQNFCCGLYGILRLLRRSSS